LNSYVFTSKTSSRTFAAFWRSSWFVIVKGWHAAEFAILFGVVLAALDRLAISRPRSNIALALALCVLFAMSDEYHQTFVPGRGGTLTDVAIDALGACSASMIAWLLVRRRMEAADDQVGTAK
jgi:VanZ family protein